MERLKQAVLILILHCLIFSLPVNAGKRYGERLCHQSDYFCFKVRYGESWYSLFPNPEERDIVKRINRMNIELRPGYVIAIPKNLERLTIYDVSPFPRYIQATGDKAIYVSQKDLAWGAYDEDGELVWWGPISPGQPNCRANKCKTPSGSFRIIRKQDIDCVSTAFPRRSNGDHGGAEMPFCMHFFRGYALHGSRTVPGYAASHGCVRMFIEDARWLNEEFIDLPGGGMKGTRVILN
jgi:hypothetical protein